MLIRRMMLVGVTAVVVTIGVSVGGQQIVDREAAIRVLDRYERGLAADVRFANGDSFDASLAAAAPAWIDAAPIAERARRRRIVALVAIEAYAATGQPDIESACGWLRQGEPDAFERLWHLATLALISRQRAVGISRVAHFDHAASRFPEEPRFALAKLLLRPEIYARSTRPVPRDTLARTIERGIVGSSFARQPNRIPRTLDDLQQFPLDDHTGAEARAHLSVVRFLLGDLAGSARDATTAAGATSDSFVQNLAWLTAGLAHARMGQPTQAMNAYRAATEAEPTAKASATLFAIHSFLNGDRSAAAAAVDAAYGSDAPAIDPWQQPNGDERFLRRYLTELRALVGYTGPPLTDLFPITAWPGLAGTTAAMVPATPRELDRHAQSEARPQADDRPAARSSARSPGQSRSTSRYSMAEHRCRA